MSSDDLKPKNENLCFHSRKKKNVSFFTCFLLKPFGQISSEVKVDSVIP